MTTYAEQDFETVRGALGSLEEFAWNALARIEAENKRLRAELQRGCERDPLHQCPNCRQALEGVESD